MPAQVRWKSGGTQQLYLGSVRFAWMGDAPEGAAVSCVLNFLEPVVPTFINAPSKDSPVRCECQRASWV
eukprot:1146623-Pelagomonas_calceolata.AAC.1